MGRCSSRLWPRPFAEILYLLKYVYLRRSRGIYPLPLTKGEKRQSHARQRLSGGGSGIVQRRLGCRPGWHGWNHKPTNVFCLILFRISEVFEVQTSVFSHCFCVSNEKHHLTSIPESTQFPSAVSCSNFVRGFRVRWLRKHRSDQRPVPDNKQWQPEKVWLHGLIGLYFNS